MNNYNDALIDLKDLLSQSKLVSSFSGLVATAILNPSPIAKVKAISGFVMDSVELLADLTVNQLLGLLNTSFIQGGKAYYQSARVTLDDIEQRIDSGQTVNFSSIESTLTEARIGYEMVLHATQMIGADKAWDGNKLSDAMNFFFNAASSGIGYNLDVLPQGLQTLLKSVSAVNAAGNITERMLEFGKAIGNFVAEISGEYAGFSTERQNDYQSFFGSGDPLELDQYQPNIDEVTTGASATDDSDAIVYALSGVLNEGSASSQGFYVFLSDVLSHNVTFSYSVYGLSGQGYATENVDFVGNRNQSATFPAGQKYVFIPVNVMDDSKVEGQEKVLLAIYDAVGANLSNGLYNDLKTGWIVDDDSLTLTATELDTPLVDLNAGNGTDLSKANIGVQVKNGEDPFVEGDTGERFTYSFEITSDKPLSSDLYVNWKVLGYGSDSADATDFDGGIYPSGRERIEAGDIIDPLRIHINGDDVPEFDEGFRVEIWLDRDDSDRAAVTQKYAYGTILNNDGLISKNDDFGDDFNSAFLMPADPNALSGTIEQPTDVDMFKVFLLAGVTYQIIFSGLGGGLSGAEYTLLDQYGTVIPNADLFPDNKEYFQAKFTPIDFGTYYIRVNSLSADTTGNYYGRFSPILDSADGLISSDREQGTIGTFDGVKDRFVFNLRSFAQPDSTISFKSDYANFDMTAFDVNLYEQNGKLVPGNWVNVGDGVWNFDFAATANFRFLLEIMSTDASSNATFQVAFLDAGTSLTSVQTEFVGTAVGETIDANGLDNIVNGLGANDVLNGYGGDDELNGGNGDDRLFGGTGNDLLIGGAGRDEMNGGAGIDTVSYASASQAVNVDLFLNTATGGSAQGDTFFLVENITGSNFSDIIRGDSSANTILGGTGNDQLRGGNNNDVLKGGDGLDQIYGEDGDDQMFGEDGIDLLYGGNGNDSLWGGALGDRLFGGAQNDRLFGGDGNDILKGGGGRDKLFGELGEDVLKGEKGNDLLVGGANNDKLIGGSGKDTLKGGGGSDNLIGGGGNDKLLGGSGRDLLNGGAGNDNLQGGAGKDKLFGGSGSDTISGGAGADRIVGGGGNDILLGGTSATSRDTFVFSGNFGDDRVEDFDVGTDKIAFGESGLKYSDLTVQNTVEGTLISYAGDSILLAGVPKILVSASDFIFEA